MALCHHSYPVAPCLETCSGGVRQGFGSPLCLRGSSSQLLPMSLESPGYKPPLGGRSKGKKHHPSLCPREWVDKKTAAFTKLMQNWKAAMGGVTCLSSASTYL